MLDTLTGSRVLSAIAILMSSLGGRYLMLHLDERQERILQDPMVLHIILFCVLFLATRDLLASLVVWLVVVAILYGTREKSRSA